jgi:hypothetical protein
MHYRKATHLVVTLLHLHSYLQHPLLDIPPATVEFEVMYFRDWQYRPSPVL